MDQQYLELWDTLSELNCMKSIGDVLLQDIAPMEEGER